MLVVRDDGEDRLLFNNNDDDNVGVGLFDPTKKLFLLCLCGLLPVDVAALTLLGSALGRRRVALDAFIVLNSTPSKMEDEFEFMVR